MKVISNLGLIKSTIILFVLLLGACSQSPQPVTDDGERLTFIETGSNYSDLSDASGELSLQQTINNSPSACGVYAANPHNSNHSPGKVNATASVSCRRSVPSGKVTAVLYKKNWYLGYVRVGSDSFSNTNARSFKANANASCSNARYGLTASGSVKDVDGKSYYGNSYNYNDVTCN